MSAPAEAWPEIILSAVRDRRAADAAPHAIDLARSVISMFAGAEGVTREVDGMLRQARAVLAVAGVRP